MRRLTFIACMSLCLAGQAAEMREALIGGQVSMGVDTSGKLTSCGITFAAVEAVKDADLKGPLTVFNGSFVLYSLSGGLLKGRIGSWNPKDAQGKGFNLNQVKPLPTTKFWFKAQGSAATAPQAGTGMFPSEDDPGYVLYAAPLKSTFAFAVAIENDESIQIGLQAKGEKSAKVLFGKVLLSDSEREQYTNCLNEWVDTQKALLDATGSGATKSK